MNKISLLAVFLGSALMLSGCSNPFSSGTNGDENTTLTKENISTIKTSQTGIEKCDKYLSVIRCLAESPSETTSKLYIDIHNNILLAWKDIPTDQLTTICDSLISALVTNPKVLENTNCKI